MDLHRTEVLLGKEHGVQEARREVVGGAILAPPLGNYRVASGGVWDNELWKCEGFGSADGELCLLYAPAYAGV